MNSMTIYELQRYSKVHGFNTGHFTCSSKKGDFEFKWRDAYYGLAEILSPYKDSSFNVENLIDYFGAEQLYMPTYGYQMGWDDENRDYVFAFHCAAHKYCYVVNFRADLSDVNEFLTLFDVSDRGGQHRISDDRKHQEVWFECSMEFFNMLHTETVARAFKKMGVELVFNYPFKNK